MKNDNPGNINLMRLRRNLGLPQCTQLNQNEVSKSVMSKVTESWTYVSTS